MALWLCIMFWTDIRTPIYLHTLWWHLYYPSSRLSSMSSSLTKAVGSPWVPKWKHSMNLCSWIILSIEWNMNILPPPLYKRYIDDGVGVNRMKKSELDTFINWVFPPFIKFTYETSEKSFNFTDITITLHWTSTLFGIVQTYRQQLYQMYPSSHPISCKGSIPFFSNSLPP